MTLWYFASYLLLPYAIASLVWRGLRYEAYWHRWPQRFGWVERRRDQRIIWVHAVSVGEVRSAAALIRALDRQYPEHRILVTTMTPTGSEQVLELFGDRVVHTYVPYDFPDAVARFLSRVAPELAVVAETEFWPNIFSACKHRGIPLFLVNVRLSRASYEGYQWVGETARAMFASADLVCAQTELDAERLRDLGVNSDLIEVTGNLKFDVPVPDRLHVEARALRNQWGKDRPVLIAASTHPGEERQILDAFEKLRETKPDLLLVIVPRHPERFAAVYRLCRKRVGRVEQRSYITGALSPDTCVLVGDTMGELQRLYAASDVAFIGGSLVRRGGQNLLEA
jgi:3-deoxy-D-manno-octulosonic-acid transferase